MKDYLNEELISKALKNSGYKYTYNDYLKILNKLQDEESKYILFYRIMYDATHDTYYSLKLIEDLYLHTRINSNDAFNMRAFIEFLLYDKNYERDIYFIGKEFGLVRSVHCLSPRVKENIKIIYYDKKVTEGDLRSDPQWEMHEKELKYLKEYDRNAIYIIVNKHYDYYYKKLLAKKIPKSQIYRSLGNWPWMGEMQYFGDPILRPKEDEIYVDGGTFIFDTIENFVLWSKRSYKKIYAFEPMHELYELCKKSIKEQHVENIKMYDIALWDCEDKLKFEEKTFGGSTVAEPMMTKDDCSYYVKANSIDNILNGKPATLIKYDVEGAEQTALNGTKKTIRKYKPRLLVSVYHFPMDVLKLGLHILKLNPNYEFYLRHQSFTSYETVLYCFDKYNK